MLKDQTFFFADTTVNIDPTAEELAEIALLTADAVRRFDIEPRVAMISFSNFGSNTHASALKVKTRGRARQGGAAGSRRSTARCRRTTRSCPRCWRRSTPGRRCGAPTS